MVHESALAQPPNPVVNCTQQERDKNRERSRVEKWQRKAACDRATVVRMEVEGRRVRKLGMKSQNQDVGKGDGGVPQELEERGVKGRMETWVEARGARVTGGTSDFAQCPWCERQGHRTLM